MAQDPSLPTSAPGADLSIAALHAAYLSGTSPRQTAEAVYRMIEELADEGIFLALRPLADVLADVDRLGPLDPTTKPLYGVPFAVKDNIDVVGLPTTAACPAFAYTPAQTAPAVAALQAAGALLIGKTNLDQFATGLVGVRSPYPIPKNAIDPALVPGGSSSGSAVAVAQGLVTFALGTDTAGSGRIPAGLNRIVGLKPSVGAVSTRGVVPACRTLDCVSVFAGSVDDAFTATRVMAVADPLDAYQRPLALGAPGAVAPGLKVGIPRTGERRFFGDALQEAAFDAALDVVRGLGATLVEIDMAPFYETAALLYEGPWVAERHAATRAFLAEQPDEMHPTTRRVIEGAIGRTATEAFEAGYRLMELKRVTAPTWRAIDLMLVPTAPISPTLADLAADPIGPNSRLGTYTNFVNLLDLAALAVPGPDRADGRAAGVTLIGPRGSDARLASFGRLIPAAIGARIGATAGVMAAPPLPAVAPAGFIEVVVVGAHLSGMPLNGELTRLGGQFVRAVATAPSYRFYALAGGPPKRPGLVRVADQGVSIDTEVWALPPEGFGLFVAGIPAPLGIGTVMLADGTTAKGFLCEPAGLQGAVDISHLGGWRAFVKQAA